MKNIFLFAFVFAFVFVAFLLGSSPATAGTKIAFLEVYDSAGKLVQYEPNSRFGHSALQVGNLWLQSYPGEGVKLITLEELKHRGKIAEVLDLPLEISPSAFEIFS